MSKLYQVTCGAPKPLAANPFECIAHSEKDALKKFKLRNNIVDTDHPISVNEVRDATAEEDAALGEDPDGDEDNDGEDQPKAKRKRQVKKPQQAASGESNTEI